VAFLFRRYPNESELHSYFSRMKKLLTLLLVLCLIHVSKVQAQMPPPPIAPGLMQWFTGWYISAQGDTVNGRIFLSNPFFGGSCITPAIG